VFRLTKSFSVAVGTFNIYAFRPPFVASLDPPSGVEKQLKIETDFFQPGFKYVFADRAAMWLVRPDRFVAEASGSAYNCGDAVARVLESLPWTPISAVGHNFRFSGPALADNAVSLPPDFYAPTPDFTLKQKTWHVALSKDDATFNLSLEATDSVTTLVANVHHPLPQQDACSGVGFARRFEEFRSTVSDLLHNVFQAKTTT
jgi:hypothetical protein